MGDGPRFAVLGPVRGWRGDAELDLGAPQQRAMLAFLLLQEGRAVAAQTIMAALWGERPPGRALGAVRAHASRLRSAIERDRTRPGVLLSAGDGYQLLLPDGALDATRFRSELASAESARASGDLHAARHHVAEALALWTGPPLEEVPGPFAHAQRARLAEWRLAALQTRFELDLELGLHEEAVAELAALAAEHPLREGFQRLLMLALHRSGRHAEAIEVFDRSRSLLDAELGLDPSPELLDLRRRIAAAALAPGEGGGALREVSGAGVAQLPTDLIDFSGREAEVAELVRVLSSGAAVAAVHGPVGVGKSALALRVAHQVRDSYPDGQLYADLRRGDPDAILLDFLRTLGVPADGVPARSGRVALFRSALRGRRMLLVLDNAPDAESLRPLLPVGGCSALVTCPARPDVPHAIEPDVPHTVEPDVPHTVEPDVPHTVEPDVPHTVEPDVPHTVEPDVPHTVEPDVPHTVEPDVPHTVEPDVPHTVEPDVPHTVEPDVPHTVEPDVPHAVEADVRHTVELSEFSEREAVALFGRIAGPERVQDEPDAVAEALALCGRLPLAVRILAARLASRPGWTVGSLVRRLADERRRLAELKVGTLDVEASFARARARLDASQDRAFRLLAEATGAFTLDAAAELLGVPPDEARAVLDALRDLGLLTSPSSEHYRYPDLLRLYARQLP
ncbi:BTAD domain-containing putative transcriptional regulator [Actinomadura rupiterrae]|uniref:BTAD domain-containing putative transcriptional regulator n=1 Tax=Actinomadura rupiterrae TaxID=559627 RepID=UPI0020A53FBA|nr:BTAD domain-containing putative transcriptional regulator [Actinomadura rupiterrae]MCP2341842.1 DNA-binding SARP family transcriptional activator/PAS domain-containing protein [Actinomadura rupiterrae]